MCKLLQPIPRNILEDCILHSHRRGSLRFEIGVFTSEISPRLSPPEDVNKIL
jgi:hypothetical protein